MDFLTSEIVVFTADSQYQYIYPYLALLINGPNQTRPWMVVDGDVVLSSDDTGHSAAVSTADDLCLRFSGMNASQSEWRPA